MIDGRPLREIEHHYRVEVELATRLKEAQREERIELYNTLYDELFKKVPRHPQLIAKKIPNERVKRAKLEFEFLARFLPSFRVFLEIGAGDCGLSTQVARFASKVIAIDVSDRILRNVKVPRNVSLKLSNGITIPVKPSTVNVVYSNQLMEHLHPDDASEQLANILKSLAPGGKYFCITPNRLSGPHDVSRYFDTVARGFHLKEYTNTELRQLMLGIGFRKVMSFICVRFGFYRIPIIVPLFLELFLGYLPEKINKGLARATIFREILGIRLVAVK
jgi:SAM-dependent methyltransferase